MLDTKAGAQDRTRRKMREKKKQTSKHRKILFKHGKYYKTLNIEDGEWVDDLLGGHRYCLRGERNKEGQEEMQKSQLGGGGHCPPVRMLVAWGR